MALALVAVGAGVLFALGQGGTTPAGAQAEPEMAFRIGSCTEDCEVLIDAGFALSIDAPVIPAGGYSGFSVEVHLDGMTFSRRSCEEDVLIEPLELCLGPTIPTSAEILYGGITGISAPPFPASQSTELVEMAVTCTEVGEYEFALVTFPSSGVGSQFTGLDGSDILVPPIGTREVPGTVANDPNRLTTVEREVGAVFAVSCVSELTQEPTDEPDGADATATPEPDLPGTGDGAALAGGSAVTPLVGATALVLVSVALGFAGWRLRRAVRS